jgi:hypothetical protein
VMWKSPEAAWSPLPGALRSFKRPTQVRNLKKNPTVFKDPLLRASIVRDKEPIQCVCIMTVMRM